jgi:hypothetical protein
LGVVEPRSQALQVIGSGIAHELPDRENCAQLLGLRGFPKARGT